MEVGIPVRASREEEIFMDEFVRIGSTAQLFRNGFLEASNNLIDLLIRSIPDIDEFLESTPYKQYTENLSTAIQSLAFIQELVQQYDSYLGEKKRETVRRKLDEHLRPLNHCQRVRYILIQFGMLHYQIFQHSFDTIRINSSHHQAIRRGANELATVFIQHLAVKKEDIPQHLLQSFMWGNDTYLWKVWRGIKVLGRSYDFQDDDGVGISTFDFHTVPVVIFNRGQDQLWAKKIEMKKQASFFGKTKEFNRGQQYLGLKLIRLPYSYEQTLFNGISEEQIRREFEDVTTTVQNRIEIGQEVRERNRKRHGLGRGRGDDDDNNGGDDTVALVTFQDQDQDERQSTIGYHLVRMERDAPSITIEDVTTSFSSLTQSVLCEKEVDEWKLELREELRTFVEDKMFNDKKFKINSSTWETSFNFSAFAFAPLSGSFGLSSTLSTWSQSTLTGHLLTLVGGALVHAISNPVEKAAAFENKSDESCSIPPFQLNPSAVEILNYALEPLSIQIPENGKIPSMTENEVIQSLTKFQEEEVIHALPWYQE